ncbi:unnamed protein product [Calypogeia fissa]
MSTNERTMCEGTSAGGTRAEGTPIAIQTQERVLRQEEEQDHEELLPRLIPDLPDDVAVIELGRLLPWTAYYTLNLVSRSWQRVIARRELYEAKVRAHSTETFVVITGSDSNGLRSRLGLYSIKDKYCLQVPPLPDNAFQPPPPNRMLAERIAVFYNNVITLAGKIYVLGGLLGRVGSKWFTRPDEVFVLDIAAGQSKWKQCASMLEVRTCCWAASFNGKIYVLGSNSDDGTERCSCEVYDPKMDIWSPIKPMPSRRFVVCVRTVGEELFVYSMQYNREQEIDPSREQEDSDEDDLETPHPYNVLLDVYNAAEDEWRTVGRIRRAGRRLGRRLERYFTARGHFHAITRLDIEAYDMETNSWTRLHSNSFSADGLIRPIRADTDLICFEAQCVDDELLLIALVHYKKCLLRSKGFGGENYEIVWQKLNCSRPHEEIQNICPIEL